MSSEVTDQPTHRALGLTDSEFEDIRSTLGRDPNHLELAMYSVMWSEHCSYKSSRIHLRRLPSEGDDVLVGPGEGAGVLDVGDGIAAAIRIESHNHPSAIEPYQGAATGVGGILRDIFSMGARPVAVMDPLRFGPLDDARSRWVAEGVVSGVSGYGNSVGVPTVGGETVFDPTYADNPLVNVLCLGLMPAERLVLGRAEGPGNLAVLLGSSTGRDGIGGVSVLASAGFSDAEADAEKRPSVQVGDPFEEKRLIEACLELLERELAVGVQDLGGAGITCATAETAAKGGSGMDVFVRAVPTREPAMEPFEVMTSESQERMLAIVEPARLDDVLEIARRWEIRATVIGRVTDTGQLRVLDSDGTGAVEDAEVLADVPARSLEDEAPLYDRPLAAPGDLDRRRADSPDELGCEDPAADLLAMVADTSWVWSQYDHMLFLNTVTPPGADAAVLRLKDPASGRDTGRALAMSTDGNHLWCAVDPRAGAAMTVAESVMNLAVVGARPMAMVNCLNFGNPEHPEVMWQLSEAVDGFTESLLALGVPCVGGNVSLYNESRGSDIDPTPVIGMLGIVDELSARPAGPALVEGGRLVLVGPDPAEAEGDLLAGSRWAAGAGSRGTGRIIAPDPAAVASTAEAVRNLVNGNAVPGAVLGVHDVAEGGIGLAVAEMAARSGVGATLARVPDHRTLFAESPGRAILCVDPDQLGEVLAVLGERSVPHQRIGLAGGDRIQVKGLLDVGVDEVSSAWERTLPDALDGGTTQG